jgi:hypothetical protein
LLDLRLDEELPVCEVVVVVHLREAGESDQCILSEIE